VTLDLPCYLPVPFLSIIEMKFSTLALTAITAASTAVGQVTYQNSKNTILRVDNGTYGPAVEEVSDPSSHQH
jgi:hypothetical protein